MRQPSGLGSSRSRLVAAATGVAALGLVFAQGTAGAAPAHQTARTSMHGVFGRAGDNHAAARAGAALPSAVTTTHYVYTQDGTCPDGIDVWQVTGTSLTHLQNVSVGCSLGTYFGANHLTVAASGSSHCLLFADDGDGLVDSFLIGSNGQLPTTPTSSVSVGGFPQDFAVSGSTVFESNSNANNFSPSIDAFSLGSGCTLTLLSQNSTGAENDIVIAMANSTTVVSTDLNSGNMVAYKWNGSTLSESVTTPGQISSPDGVAALSKSGVTNVYTGQATFSPPQTQGFRFNGSSFSGLTGSPQTSTDPSSSNGAGVVGSIPNHLLAQMFTFSSQVGWDNLTASSMTYTSDTPMAVAGDDPQDAIVVGNNLIVAQVYGGDVEACALAPNKVSGCRTVATNTGAGSGNGGSVAFL